MASPPAPATIGSRLGSVLVSIAAALVILGASIVPFFSPAWIHGEQDRVGVPGLIGLQSDEVDRVTDAIVHDLAFGGAFDVATAPLGTLLDPREQAHMRDVRGVFQGLAVLVIGGLLVLVVAGFRSRAAARRRAAWWRAVGRGARWLTVLMAAIGILSVVAFDATFELFHELLFPPGSFDFNPATERLVQLFPDQFWSDTALALGVLAFGLSIVVAFVASRRAAGTEAATPVSTTGGASPGVASPDGASSLSPRSVP